MNDKPKMEPAAKPERNLQKDKGPKPEMESPPDFREPKSSTSKAAEGEKSKAGDETKSN